MFTAIALTCGGFFVWRTATLMRFADQLFSKALDSMETADGQDRISEIRDAYVRCQDRAHSARAFFSVRDGRFHCDEADLELIGA